jgi:glucokinase
MLGVAGRFSGKVELTNLSWIGSGRNKEETSIPEVFLINDLEATAYGLAALDEEDFITIHSGQVEMAGNMAILAPGTGLGEGGLYWNGISYHPFATEGGHTDFSPRTKVDLKLFDYLETKYEVVSWERVIAGPAIYDIYQFLRDVKKKKEPEWLKESMTK